MMFSVKGAVVKKKVNMFLGANITAFHKKIFKNDMLYVSRGFATADEN